MAYSLIGILKTKTSCSARQDFWATSQVTTPSQSSFVPSLHQVTQHWLSMSSPSWWLTSLRPQKQATGASLAGPTVPTLFPRLDSALSAESSSESSTMTPERFPFWIISSCYQLSLISLVPTVAHRCKVVLFDQINSRPSRIEQFLFFHNNSK